MGKKSRRRANNKNKKLEELLRSTVASHTSESSFVHPFENEPLPTSGWAKEQRDAERELRHDRDRPDVVFRAAKAARAMRQFDRLLQIIDKAESRGVTIDDADDRALMQKWREECLSYKNQRTRANEPRVQSLFSAALKDEITLDTAAFDDIEFSNLSALQYAAYNGDVQLLERLVGLGVALDYCADDVDTSSNSMLLKKPPRSTALLMAVLGALLCRRNVEDEETKWREVYEGEVECAIQLVRLGANVDVQFNLPSDGDANSEFYKVIKIMKWVGKSVRELAPETGSELLVQTIESFSSANDKIQLVNCRCGSRLPWKKCHSGKLSTNQHYTMATGSQQGSKKINWKYSPTAPCPCKNTQKIYYKCCWDEPLKEYFQDDEVARFDVLRKVPRHLETMLQQYHENRRQNRIRDLELHEILPSMCAYIRKHGLGDVSNAHPKSKIGTWDPNVYAGIMEIMGDDEFFQWKDVHWNIPKPELLKRVAEWNEALEGYCDNEGLGGSEREEVIELHTASPFAPCANLNCTKVETKVKEFSRCSICFHVAYCSRACSKEDYPFHKKRCLFAR